MTVEHNIIHNEMNKRDILLTGVNNHLLNMSVWKHWVFSTPLLGNQKALLHSCGTMRGEKNQSKLGLN